MSDQSDPVIFTSKNGDPIRVSDLYTTVYDSAESTKEELRLLIKQLSAMTHTPAEAVALMSHVTEMIHANIKNDDLLIKLVNIITRNIVKNKEPNSEFQLLSDDDIKQLQLEVRTESSKGLE